MEKEVWILLNDAIDATEDNDLADAIQNIIDTYQELSYNIVVMNVKVRTINEWRELVDAGLIIVDEDGNERWWNEVEEEKGFELMRGRFNKEK